MAAVSRVGLSIGTAPEPVQGRERQVEKQIVGLGVVDVRRGRNGNKPRLGAIASDDCIHVL